MKSKLPTQKSSKRDIDQFLGEVKNRLPARANGTTGRILFAIDATASRQPTWDTACHLQSHMFRAASNLGGLAISVCFFRGFDEFRASSWHTSAAELQRKMSAVRCMGGQTQIARTLRHAEKETRKRRIQAVVFIGDACEETAGPLYSLAGKLALLNTPVFVFQEGRDQRVAKIFETIAQRSGGAYCQLDENSAEFLTELLSAVAVYASGGRQALLKLSRGKPRLAQLSQQVK
ncbi:MAG: VWA domain-containing protein [Pseudomonadota bacterium]